MSELSGMTVNERLFHVGLIDQFDAAILARQKDKAIALLLRVEIDEKQAKETVTIIFENPSKYGYK